jgi:hypothetical protein
MCLGISGAVVLAALGYVGMAVLRLLRALGAAGEAASAAGERLGVQTEGLDIRAEHMALGMARLEGHLYALGESRDRARLLLFALEDVTRLLRLVRSVVSPVS